MRVEAGSEPSHDDRTIGTVDYDYEAAFGGRGMGSVSDVGGTVGSHVRLTCLDDVVVDGTGGTMATTTAITAVDEPAAVADDDRTNLDNTACDDAREVLLYVYAPSGRLGVVIDTPDDGMPTIRSVMEDSPLTSRLRVGDRLVAVDEVDVRAMMALRVSRLIGERMNNPTRKLTIIRREEGDGVRDTA